MQKSKITRRALLSSALALLLCISMLLGTTFAWFTDTVESTGNIIQSGTLDAEMWYGTELGTITTEITEETKVAIFDYEYWEPGYTDIKYVTIKNAGNLAFKYQLNIIPTYIPSEGEVNLAEVIDVYLTEYTLDETTQEYKEAPLSRENLGTKVGTLADLMIDPDGAAYGFMLPEVGATNVDETVPEDADKGSATFGIALKMQESAGNEYQNQSVGGNFRVQLLATQYTYEKDSFNHKYDKDSEYADVPKANVTREPAMSNVETYWYGDWNNEVIIPVLDPVFTFKPTESEEEGAASDYAKWHADFVISADKDVDGNDIALAGYYELFSDLVTDGNWVALQDTRTILAEEEIRLVGSMGVTVNYAEICEYGNDGTGFQCGVWAMDEESLAGTTITVELRLYEAPSTGTSSTLESETGEYITIASYKHTF